jgi:uncharacterized LabA/DUF88 family protein
MASLHDPLRVGVYVDVANVTMNGGYGMRYDVLREFACRGDSTPVRLNAYVAYDAQRAETDPSYRQSQGSFHQIIREQGFKVIEKVVKWYVDDAGTRVSKANADLDLAVHALLQSNNLDRVLLVTGDGDFVQVVNALQNKGCRVEVLAFRNVSRDLRREADMYTSGYLVPGLLPVSSGSNLAWGEPASRVRGTCYHFNPMKAFGFFRFMKNVSPALWDLDTRKPTSPYKSAFFHRSDLPAGFSPELLPSRDIVFEFDIEKSQREPTSEDPDPLQAAHIQTLTTDS